MLSYNTIGRNGRFANQLFQYAALYSIAKKHGYEFCIPPSNAQNLWQEHQLFSAFDLKSCKTVGWQRTTTQLKESTFAYDKNLVDNCPNDVDLFGYFQSEKYFKDYEQDIRNEFTFKSEINDPCANYIKQLNSEIISLHVRRTDYVQKSADHPPCSLEYYEEALKLVPPNLPIMVFSDDINWVMQQPLFKGPRWNYSQGNSNLIDICIMTYCSHYIIANSSFSWWGAWLSHNKNKIVVGPKKWFGDGPNSYTKNNDTKDLIPNGWIKI